MCVCVQSVISWFMISVSEASIFKRPETDVTMVM